MINCPNCGAPIKGNVCEYCGTISPLFEEKKRDYEQRIAKLEADLNDAKQADYLLPIMGKWVAHS